MSSPGSTFFLRISLRAFQLFCLLFVLTGLANINSLMVAIDAVMKGAMSIPSLCWKILPVTGPLIPAVSFIVATQLVLQNLRPSTHKPSEPWMANPMWAAKHIRLSNRGLFWGMAGFFLFYFGIGVPLAIATEKTAIQVAFGVIGLALFGISTVFYRNRRWNSAELRIAMVPGVIGGPFSGVAILQQSFPAGTAFDVCLKCQETSSFRSSSHGGGTSSKTETIWSSTISIDKPLPPDRPNRTLIPFSFAVPFECKPTSDWSASSKSLINWHLVVNEKAKVGYGGSVFNVPVYRTSDSCPHFTLDTELIAPFEQQVDLQAVLGRLNMTLEPLAGGGKRLTFRVWNGKVAFSMVSLVLLCVAGVFACFWFIANLYAAAFAAILPGVLMLAGLYSLLDIFLWKSSLEINQNELSCKSGWPGFESSLVASKRDRPIFRSEFDFRKENGEWYRVVMFVPSKQHDGIITSDSAVTLVKQLDGRAEADAIAEWFRRETGISEDSMLADAAAHA
jgi:hypothetical protein